jgi:DNA repair protein RadC
VIQGSASIIVAHNHPSGEVDPSEEDTKITKLLFEAGDILGIKMLDHVIFAKERFFSFRDNNLQQIMEE